MGTNDLTLADLIESVKNPENEDHVLKLLDKIESVDIDQLKQFADQFDALFDMWSEDVTRSEDKANLCVRLAELSVLDTPNFRTALHFAVRKLLPPYLGSSVVKAIGAKDPDVSSRDVAQRLRKLQHLRSTAVIYQQETRQWGKINGIDKVTGTIAVTSFRGSSVSSVPISSAVVSAQFFNTTPEFLDLLYPSRGPMPSAEYRKIIAKHALAEISETKVRDIVYNLLVPDYLAADAFTAWWEAVPEEKSAASKRSFADARSVLELDTLLKPLIDAGEDVMLSQESAAKLKKLFTNLRTGMTPKDLVMLAESISIIAASSNADLLRDMLQPLRGKAAFWPAEINDKLALKPLDTWAHISVKRLPGFIRAAGLLYTPEELAQLGVILPLRCLGLVLDSLPSEIVKSTLLKLKNLSADVILWIWRNRSKVSEYLTDSVDMGHVLVALSADALPREWTTSQRELKKQLFEKEDFQKFVIENANGDIPSILTALQKCRSFQAGERQSLMVKLARHSEELTTYIEAGSGRRMMGDSAALPEQAPVTSIKSLKRLSAELEDLITRQIPENAAAVALARSYGDLRENAEYDAAKERRRFLHKRRSDLEKTLGFIQSTDFKNVVVKDHVVIGCQVKLTAAAGADREYYLLGAWDGDPSRNFLSYKTRIGEALIDKKVGDKIVIPENGSFTIKEVLPLSDALLKELADEA